MFSQNNLQNMINGMSQQWQRERSQTDLTLGAFIALLESLSPDATVVGLGELMSYRGYYCDLAFEPTADERTVADLLAECRTAMGRTFEGYRGGDYQMGETTPLWVCSYGVSGGPRLTGLSGDTPMVPLTRYPSEDE